MHKRVRSCFVRSSSGDYSLGSWYSQNMRAEVLVHRQMSKNWQSRFMATAQAYLNPHDLREKNINIAAGEIDASPAD